MTCVIVPVNGRRGCYLSCSLSSPYTLNTLEDTGLLWSGLCWMVVWLIDRWTTWPHYWVMMVIVVYCCLYSINCSLGRETCTPHSAECRATGWNMFLFRNGSQILDLGSKRVYWPLKGIHLRSGIKFLILDLITKHLHFYKIILSVKPSCYVILCSLTAIPAQPPSC